MGIDSLPIQRISMQQALPWGIDNIVGEIHPPLSKPVEELTFQEVKDALGHYTDVLGLLEEETDLFVFRQAGGRENPRAEQGTRAEQLKEEINVAGGTYSQLVQRYIKLAPESQDPLDHRAATLMNERRVWDFFSGESGYKILEQKTGGLHRSFKLAVEGHQPLEISQMTSALETEQDPEMRKNIFLAARNGQMDGIEAALLEQIGYLTVQVRAGGKFNNFYEISARYCESPTPTEIAGIMRLFVDGTREIYNHLFSELISDKKVMPWDVPFFVAQKDPFFRLNVPTDTANTLDIAFSILEDVGYAPEVVRGLYDPTNPNVHLDIEDRDGKKAGAFTCSLGPRSFDKNILFINPRSYQGNPRQRQKVPIHETGHGLQHYYDREAVSHVNPVFFAESTVATELISMTHENLGFELPVMQKYLGASGDDAIHVAKWNLFLTLHSLYSIAAIALGDIEMHTKGTAYARQGFHDTSVFVRPDNVDSSLLTPSSSYTAKNHLYAHPAYYFAYFMADLNRIVVHNHLNEQHGGLFTPNTAPFLIDHLMKGNVMPMTQRITKATGVSDFVGAAVHYIQQTYKQLCSK